ncbi:MAG: sulfide dehydrogenase [Chlorobium sp.]|nr:MAG: sulfide dehydrogenase [Chlorobium sp.]
MAGKPGIRLTAFALLLMVFAAGSSAQGGVGSGVSTQAKKGEARRVESSPRGQILALSCTSCHGTDGKSVGIIPSISGRSADYLETALKAFKSGARYSTVMSRHAKGYSDSELRLIAEYFGTVSHNNK